MLVVMDPHSPSNHRVNAPLANLPEFQEAFGCGAATPMNRPAATRPAIW
jgi:predicted metalloendopeptidase